MTVKSPEPSVIVSADASNPVSVRSLVIAEESTRSCRGVHNGFASKSAAPENTSDFASAMSNSSISLVVVAPVALVFDTIVSVSISSASRLASIRGVGCYSPNAIKLKC